MNLPPFQTLVDEHARPLYRFLCGMVGPVAADDCLQETLLAALRAYNGLSHDENLRGWLFKITCEGTPRRSHLPLPRTAPHHPRP